MERVKCDICGAVISKATLNGHLRRHKNTESHRCLICGMSFTKMTKLTVHLKDEHNKPMQCIQCDKMFSNVHRYTAHINNHNKKRNFHCEECGATFKLQKLLKVHVLLRHGQGEYPFHCSVCAKGFLNRIQLNDHENEHNGKKPHQCEHCGAAFAKKKALEAHLIPCQGGQWKDTVFRCQICSRSYRNERGLKAHKLSGDCKGNICNVCGRTFFFYSSLRRHLQIHSDKSNVVCSTCGRKFKFSSYLKIHIRTHTGEKPYRCRFCWKMFTQRSSCAVHERKHDKRGNMGNIVE